MANLTDWIAQTVERTGVAISVILIVDGTIISGMLERAVPFYAWAAREAYRSMTGESLPADEADEYMRLEAVGALTVAERKDWSVLYLRDAVIVSKDAPPQQGRIPFLTVSAAAVSALAIAGVDEPSA